MRTQRHIVDYALQRRALLRALYAGRVGTYEVCDASPYLKSAAKFHGEQSEVRCPVCRREHVSHVHYVYGDELKQSAGQARRLAELSALAMSVRDIQVYVVEVCRGCGWNHLVRQYRLGRDGLTDPSTVAPEQLAAQGSAPGRSRSGGSAASASRGSGSAGSTARRRSGTRLRGGAPE
jgi:hypothetical protein